MGTEHIFFLLLIALALDISSSETTNISKSTIAQAPSPKGEGGQAVEKSSSGGPSVKNLSGGKI